MWAVALGAVMLVPHLRLPALMVGILSIPGNVDNLAPQMQMDLHAVANNSGPAVSVIDLLIGLAVALTLREGASAWPKERLSRMMVLVALVVFGVGLAASVGALVTLHVEPLAVLRGVLVFARIPALVFLAMALLRYDPTGFRLSVAAALGGIVLLGNGIYTSAVEEQARFTATTFGRNGLGMALALVALLAAGAAIEGARQAKRRQSAPWPVALAAPVAIGILGASALFGSIATGTRMSLFAAIIGAAGAIAVNRLWHSRRGVAQLGLGLSLGFAVVIASAIFSSAGGRAVDLGSTIDAVVDYEDLPSYSEVRTRGQFWGQALDMTLAHPLTGVGPFQWNIERYKVDANAPKLVANPHNAYLQIAAEFGLPTLLVYLTLLGLLAVVSAASQVRHHSTAARSWSTALLVGSALAYPVTELTNSHLFNVRLGAFGWLVLASALAIALQDRRARAAGRLGS